MKSYNDVVAEYRQFKSLNPDDPTPLPEFAKQLDQVQGVRDRAEAYDASGWTRLNSAIDRGFDWTPDPQVIASPRETGRGVAGFAGSIFDRLVGTHITPVLEQVGAETPRMVAEGVATAPMGGTGAWARALGLLGKVAGYGSAFTRGTAESGNLAGGAVQAGALGLGNVLIPKAGAAAERGVTSMLERGVADVTPETREIAKIVGPSVLEPAAPAIRRGVPMLANVGAGAATATGINEAQRQAMLSTLPDEMRQEGDRDPFTQENIAGNVAGTAFFLPQLMTSLIKGGPRVSPKQTEQLARQLSAEKTVKEQAPLGTTEGMSSETGSRQEALLNILSDSITNRKLAQESGRLEDVTRLDTTIEETYNEIMQGRYSPLGVENVDRMKTMMQDVVKFQTPATSEKFVELANLIKSNLDFLNEGRVRYETELAQREASLNPNDKKAVKAFQDWKAEQERRGLGTAGKEQTWHPQARAAQVLDRLWKSGDAPPLTEDWMAKEWGATFDESGNPQFANDVLAQKLSNYYADRLDTMVEAERASRKAEIAPKEYTGGKVDAREKEFIGALQTLPTEVLRDVLNRTVKIRGSERIDNRTGQAVSQMKEWQRAVVRASQSFDPESKTILVAKTGKLGEGPQYVRVPVTRLVERGENGGYLWSPSERRVSVSEGGKPAITNEAGQQVAEGNIEAIRRPSGEQMDIADEEAFKRALAEQSDMPYGDRTDLALSEANKLDEPAVDAIDESAERAETAIADKMAQKQSAFRKNLDALSDDELWRLAAPLFRLKNSVQATTKKAQLRTALVAAMENMKASKGGLSKAGAEFLKMQRDAGSMTTKGKGEVEDVKMFLRSFFQAAIPVEGVESKLPNNVQRLAQLVGKLTSDETVKRVKSAGPSVKMQEAVEWPHGMWLDPDGKIINNETGHMETGIDILKSKIPKDSHGSYDDTEFDEIFEGMRKRGYVQLRGDASGISVISKGLTRTQKAALERLGIEHGTKIIDVTRDSPETIYEPPQRSPSVKPQTSGDTAPIDRGTLANQPPPGRFVEDVARTLRKRIDGLFSRAGYSGTAKEFYTELAVALAQQNVAENTDFYRIAGKQYGIAGTEHEGRAPLGINVDRAIAAGDEAKAVLELMQTIGHEIGHIDGYIRDGLIQKPDAYSQERERLLHNFDRFGNSLTEDERAAMLTVVQEFVPEKLRGDVKQADGRPYGTSNVDEFAQQMRGAAMTILAHETPQGRAVALEMMSYMPPEVRDLWRDTFRTTKDIMEVMRQATEDPAVRAAAGEQSVLSAATDPFILSRGFETMLDTARYMTKMNYADRAMAEARSFVGNMRAPNLDQTNSVWFTKDTLPTQLKAQESLPKEPSETAVEAVGTVRDFLNGPRALDKSKQLGLVGTFLAPFRHQMWAMERNGNQMARPIADSIFQLEAGAHRLLSGLLEPFMKRKADGSVQFDAENALIKRISEDPHGRWRDEGVNKVAAWQQAVHEMADGKKLDAQQMFVKNEKGEVVVNPNVKDAQAAWDKIRANFSKEDQAFIMSQSLVLDQIGQNARERLLASIAESNANRAASLLQAMNKQMPAEQAIGLGKQVHDAFLSGNVLSLAGTIPPKQIEILQRLMTGPDGKSGLLNHFLEVSQHFDNRPGYRSESLPHDWVIRYRNSKNEVKFDSRPTEQQAIAWARQLQEKGNRIDGEIVNRKDVNKFSPTDDPDGILVKVTERENFVWNKFIEEMTQKHGPEFGGELSKGYTPMETTMRAVSAQGIGKFLKERKGFVDRSAHDYIDSTMAYAERLSYTVAVRSMKQRVELLLNDPSVRLQPSFQNLVRGHIAEFLRPQSQTLKELRGIVTGLMIGGNLGSVVANAMQSLSTLVPVLDLQNGGKGTFIQPWKQLGKAIADATDFTLGHGWKDLAARTKGRDPSTWSADETAAELWRRHVEAGGFTHTVVDDLVFGQDQKMLTNAKFGRGDYGPVAKADLVRSGLYLGNQLAMKPFRWVEHGNAKVAFLAGVRQAYEQGLRGDAAYAKATQLQGLATFGGGRANSSGLQTALSKGFTPGGAGLALALQQYGFGIVAMHGQFVRDALGRSKALSPTEVWHARRAYGTYLMTQTALAGALGFPLVGATLTALEKVFGIPANQAVRQGLASLGSDDESGATIAEIGLNGFADYWTGLDVSSRLGTSSLLGTSSYRGFNLSDLAGPAGSIIEGGVKALGYFGQGEPMKAASELAPIALKRAIEMTDSQSKYGDNGIRDKAGNLLYMPTDSQATAYAFGIRPRELSRKRQLQSALQTASTITQESRDRELDAAAQDLLRGDNSRAQRLAQEATVHDPLGGMQATLRAIMDRAVAAQTPKDPMATGSRYNEEERSAIYRTFGKDVAPRRSEVEMEQLRLQMAQMLGDPRIAPTADSFSRAAIVDSLVRGGSMTRSEALRIVQMLGM